ncbi:hypothetical protein [Aeromonas hydrophila]|uniref:hypothetical protein n=1 Tax=Aeromonas hydrophila TaxID=644 RepID=UPI002927FB03|nr:hypothetical protein [Aeromonas hydrophila]
MAKKAKKLDEWQQGVMYAVAQLMAVADQPVDAKEILKGAGLLDADCSELDDFERKWLRKLRDCEGVPLTGLDRRPDDDD